MTVSNTGFGKLKPLIGVAALAFAGSASAQLIGISPSLPDVELSGGTFNVSYSESTDTLSITQSGPAAAGFADGLLDKAPGDLDNPIDNPNFTLNAIVDSNGNLVGTGTFELRGAVLSEGITDAMTVLLSGNIVQLGFQEDAGGNPVTNGTLDFLTDGPSVGDGLSSVFGTPENGLGIILNSANFNGWDVDWSSNSAFADITTNAPVSLPSSLVLMVLAAAPVVQRIRSRK